jgi:hypothetical protein
VLCQVRLEAACLDCLDSGVHQRMHAYALRPSQPAACWVVMGAGWRPAALILALECMSDRVGGFDFAMQCLTSCSAVTVSLSWVYMLLLGVWLSAGSKPTHTCVFCKLRSVRMGNLENTDSH